MSSAKQDLLELAELKEWYVIFEGMKNWTNKYIKPYTEIEGLKYELYPLGFADTSYEGSPLTIRETKPLDEETVRLAKKDNTILKIEERFFVVRIYKDDVKNNLEIDIPLDDVKDKEKLDAHKNPWDYSMSPKEVILPVSFKNWEEDFRNVLRKYKRGK